MTASWVDCAHPNGTPCGLCLDRGQVRRSLLYRDEINDSINESLTEVRVWTDLSEPPVTAWWTATDSRHVTSILAAAVTYTITAVRNVVCAPARWRWAP